MANGWPNIRIDHQNQPAYDCYNCAIAVGPGAPSHQPLYVVFQSDTLPGGRTDVWFQKSTDGGRTWLPEDVLIRHGNRYAFDPDITTDSDGNVCIVYTYETTPGDTARHFQIVCVRSSDGGATWTAPSRVDDDSSDDDSPNGSMVDVQIGSDSAGNLLCAWVDWRTGMSHILSSVSTDGGATWRRNVRVDDDTTDDGCFHPDVFVQPGTNQYLVAADAYRWFGGHVIPCAYLYCSTDRGQTFQPGVQLDTFNYAASSPHVVADRAHITCDYFGEAHYGDRMLVESRTFYTQPDTWGTPHSVTNLDSLHDLYLSGTLALSGDGRVHTALMICDVGGPGYNIFYASSSDHGVSWTGLELVDEDTTLNSGCPDIGADSTGHAYVVWPHGNAGQFRIWFATNRPAGIAEQPLQVHVGTQPFATMFRNVLLLPEATIPKPQAASLLDISGRKVMDLHPGANDVRALAPGVYFVKEAQAQAQAQAVRKVVVTR